MKRRGDDVTVEQLCEKYPEIPRSIVIKTDLLNRGLNFTPELSNVGDDGLSETMRGFKFHHDVIEEDGKELMNLPWSFHFMDETYIKLILDLDSPYKIHEDKDAGRWMLHYKDEPMEEVAFPKKPKWYQEKISDGTSTQAYLFEIGPCHATGIVPLDYCEYFFKDEKQCKFCDWNPTFDLAKAAGYRSRVAMRASQLAESFNLAFENPAERCDHAHIFVAGGLYNIEKELDIYITMLNELKELSDYAKEAWFLLGTQALTKEQAIRAKEAGFVYATWNLETWQKKHFDYICPGKAEAIGYDEWRKRLEEGVDVWGPGHLSSNLVLGPELVIPGGFKDEDKAIESNLEGFEWLLQRGIFPFIQFWRCSPNSLFSDLDLEQPSTEYYLQLSLENHRLCEKYQIYNLIDPRHKASCHRCGLFYNHYDFARLIDQDEGPKWNEWEHRVV